MDQPKRRRSNLPFILLGGIVSISLVVYVANLKAPPPQNKLVRNPFDQIPPLVPEERPPVSEANDDQAFEALKEALADKPLPDDVEARLQDAHHDSALPMLIEMMSHPQSPVRERVCKLVKELTPSASAVPPLLKLLSDPDSGVRVAAIEALGVHGTQSDQAIPALGKKLQDEKELELVTCGALETLANNNPMQTEQAAAVMIAALEKAGPYDAYNLVRALKSFGTAARPAIPKLLKLLGKSWSDTEIVGVLAQCGQFDALQPFIDDRSEEKRAERVSIAQGLGRLRPMSAEAIVILERLFSETDSKVRIAVIESVHDG
ncbi:MAG: HEAT repeat domain-containing protein, partial [Planctomycetota bacterium]